MGRPGGSTSNCCATSSRSSGRRQGGMAGRLRLVGPGKGIDRRSRGVPLGPTRVSCALDRGPFDSRWTARPRPTGLLPLVAFRAELHGKSLTARPAGRETSSCTRRSLPRRDGNTPPKNAQERISSLLKMPEGLASSTSKSFFSGQPSLMVVRFRFSRRRDNARMASAAPESAIAPGSGTAFTDVSRKSSHPIDWDTVA